MEPVGKLICGGLASAALAFASHAMGNGDAAIQTISAGARQALDAKGLRGVTVSFPDNPVKRVALLSGSSDAKIRADALAVARAAPGIIDARWVEPEPAATPASSQHCQSKVDSAIAGRNINFRSGSPWVNAPARALLGDVARALAACPAGNLTVDGYADATGSAAINQSLSQARAEAVKAILIEKGVAAARITAVGHGAQKEGEGVSARRIGFAINGG